LNSFTIIVKTNTPKTELLQYNKEKKAYLMNVKALPLKGLANKEIIKFFKKQYKKDVRIIKGKTSKTKVLKVDPKL